MGFIEQRITKVEGFAGSISSLVCTALNISLIVEGDAFSLPIAVASLFVMVRIA